MVSCAPSFGAWLEYGGARVVLGAIGVAHAGELLAQEDDFLVRGVWGQIQDALGIPVLLAFAMSMALFFVLARGLRREIERRIKVEVESVSTVIQKGKVKRFGKSIGRRDHVKKAYVSLKAGQELNFSGEAA